MTFDEAKTLLASCKREELCDHAFGDREFYWMREGKEVAYGYAGKLYEVAIGDTHFGGDEAKELASLGANVNTSRNDTTGPEQYHGA